MYLIISVCRHTNNDKRRGKKSKADRFFFDVYIHGQAAKKRKRKGKPKNVHLNPTKKYNVQKCCQINLNSSYGNFRCNLFYVRVFAGLFIVLTSKMAAAAGEREEK